jgi:hypothetical protein
MPPPIPPTTPWMHGGDFNMIRDSHEKNNTNFLDIVAGFNWQHYQTGGILLVFLSCNKILPLVIAYENLTMRHLVGESLY